MVTLTIPNRPFSTHPATGLMMPDGVFEAALGVQEINAQFRNDSGASLAAGTTVYLEGVSDPSIAVTPRTAPVGDLPAGGTRVLAWDADFANTPAGTYRISFVCRDPGGAVSRQIKKIFVTSTTFDPTTAAFSAQTPEGTLTAVLADLIGPTDGACCSPDKRGLAPTSSGESAGTLLDLARRLYHHRDPAFEFCPPGYLPHRVHLSMQPTPPYSGQFGDLPFQDPWWKIIFCIIAVLLLIAAAVVEAFQGSGSVAVTAGSPDPAGGSTPDCCGVRASGGGTSQVAAGLVAAAAAMATLAACSDVRDPFRRGQDNTAPAEGELTLHEEVDLRMTPNGPLTLGKPSRVAVEWDYTRTTTAGTRAFSVQEIGTNVHVLSRYEIDAPDVVLSYKNEPFIIRGRFFDGDGNELSGPQLYVQCFLTGPAGQWRRLVMQDDGARPDERPADGTYTARYDFLRKEERDFRGIWTFFVIAQDVNDAQPDLSPDEAAQIIGGMVVTSQLTIDMGGGSCPLVPDGHVNVI